MKAAERFLKYEIKLNRIEYFRLVILCEGTISIHKSAILFLDQPGTIFVLPKEQLFHLILLSENLLLVREGRFLDYFI